MRWGRHSSEIQDQQGDSLAKGEGRQASQEGQTPDTSQLFSDDKVPLPSVQMGQGAAWGWEGLWHTCSLSSGAGELVVWTEEEQQGQ